MEKQNKKIENTKQRISLAYFPKQFSDFIEGSQRSRSPYRELYDLITYLGFIAEWDFEKIKKFIISWNKKNKIPIRDTYLNLWFKSYEEKIKNNYVEGKSFYKKIYKDQDLIYIDFTDTNDDGFRW